MNKKIIFQEVDHVSTNFAEMPKPIKNTVADWYKDDKNFSHGDNDILKFIKLGSNATYKMCQPLIDTMTSGYVIALPAAVSVFNDSQNGYVPRIDWQVDWDVCDALPLNTIQNYPIPYKHNGLGFRWKIDWIIKTPPGYSVWITHPSQRYDLPFTTINGFVDTDQHPNALLLPFFVREGFEGIIEKDTPIAQIIPIKREGWVSERKPIDPEYMKKRTGNVKMDYLRTYKNRYWSKKKYD